MDIRTYIVRLISLFSSYFEIRLRRQINQWRPCLNTFPDFQKYHAACRIFDSLTVFGKCAEITSYVFDTLHVYYRLKAEQNGYVQYFV